MRRLAYLLCLALVPACGDDTTTNPQHDMSVAAGDMTAPSDMIAALNGTRIATGLFELAGVTPDGHAWGFNDKGQIIAVPVDGSGQVEMVDSVQNSIGLASGNVIVTWDTVDQNTAIGSMAIWTPTGGATMDIAANSPAGIAAVTSDGAYVLYVDNSIDGKTGDVFIAKTDGTGITKVLTGVDLGGMCGFTVATAGKKFALTHCPQLPAAPDGGLMLLDGGLALPDLGLADAGSMGPPPTPSLYLLDPSTTEAVGLLEQTQNTFEITTAGDRIAILTAMGDLYSVPTDGTAATMIDSGVSHGHILPDGSMLFYTKANTTELWRSPSTSSAPVKLVASGALDLAYVVNGGPAVSPDGKYLIYLGKYDRAMANSTLYLTSATTMGTPITLSAQTTGSIYGDAFTSDSSQALYITAANADAVGDLDAMPVSGGTATKITSLNWQWFTVGGTKIVFNDDYVKGQPGEADIHIADVAGGTSTLVATQAEAYFFLTPARDKIVYSYILDQSTAGIYVAPIQ